MDPNTYRPVPGPQPPYPGSQQPYPNPAGSYQPQPPAGYGQPVPANYGPQAPYGVPPAPYGPPAPIPPAPPATAAQPYGNQPPYAGQPSYTPPGYLQPNPFAAASTPAYEPPAAKSPLSGKLPLIIGAVVVLIIITVVAVAASGSGSKGTGQAATQKSQQQTQAAAMADVVARGDSDLDLSQKIDTAKTLKAQSLKAKVKDQVNLSSGFSFMVKDIGDYQSSTTQPGAGKKFVIVLIEAGNRSQSDPLSVSYLDFKLRDSSNNLLSGHPLTQQILNNPLSSPTQIKPGGQITGRLIFEVAAADTDWDLVHSETYQKTTDGTTFTVEGHVAVSLKPAATASQTAQPTAPAAGH